MSFRSSLIAPSTQSGEVGRIFSATQVGTLLNLVATNQTVVELTLPAGTYVITTELEITSGAAVSGFLYYTLYPGSSVPAEPVIFATAFFPINTNQLLSGCKCLTLTGATQQVYITVAANMTAGNVTYANGNIQALKIA